MKTHLHSNTINFKTIFFFFLLFWFNFISAQTTISSWTFEPLQGTTANPTSNFAAIMTCSHADKNCPIVQGASIKISTPYEDPKDADGKPNETEVYNERCKQIATEVLYAFSLVKSGK